MHHRIWLLVIVITSTYPAPTPQPTIRMCLFFYVKIIKKNQCDVQVQAEKKAKLFIVLCRDSSVTFFQIFVHVDILIPWVDKRGLFADSPSAKLSLSSEVMLLKRGQQEVQNIGFHNVFSILWDVGGLFYPTSSASPV